MKKPRKGKLKPTLKDALDYVKEWHGRELSPFERAAIESVCAEGERYGYGNLIGWLSTAWAIMLIDHWDIDPEIAVQTTHGTPYPIPGVKRKKQSTRAK